MPQPTPLPRLVPVPQADPPYDDERGPGQTDGSLALAYAPAPVEPKPTDPV